MLVSKLKCPEGILGPSVILSAGSRLFRQLSGTAQAVPAPAFPVQLAAGPLGPMQEVGVAKHFRPFMSLGVSVTLGCIYCSSLVTYFLLIREFPGIWQPRKESV